MKSGREKCLLKEEDINALPSCSFLQEVELAAEALDIPVDYCESSKGLPSPPASSAMPVTASSGGGWQGTSGGGAR